MFKSSRNNHGGTISIFCFCVTVLMLSACSSGDKPAESGIPDLSRKGEWSSVYREAFTQESLSDNWVPLKGPSFDNLHEIPGTFVGWDIADKRLKGKTSEAIGLRLKGKFYGDLEFHIKFTHTLKHRNFIISLGDKNFDQAASELASLQAALQGLLQSTPAAGGDSPTDISLWSG